MRRATSNKNRPGRGAQSCGRREPLLHDPTHLDCIWANKSASPDRKGPGFDEVIGPGFRVTEADGRVFDFECDPTRGGGEKEAMMWLQWLR